MFRQASFILSHILLADMLFQLQSPDGTLQTIRIPFGNPALLYLLEYVVEELQYRRYLRLDADGWKPRLKNAIYLATVSYGWALLKKFRGQTMEFGSEETGDWYKRFADRMATATDDEKRLFEEEVMIIYRALL
jgi:hypothetical protein